jgi:hypothetical protein
MMILIFSQMLKGDGILYWLIDGNVVDTLFIEHKADVHAIRNNALKARNRNFWG